MAGVVKVGLARKRKHGTGRLDLAFFQVPWFPLSGFRGEVENASVNQRPRRQSCFQIDSKNTHVAEDVAILLCVKFR